MQDWADYVLVYAGEFIESSATLFTLKHSHLIIVGAEYAKSPIGKILEVDVLKATYKIENICWVLNSVPGAISLKSILIFIENKAKKVIGFASSITKKKKWQTT